MKIIFTSIVFFLGVVIAPTVAHAQDIYGDVNSDGEVNIADANAIIGSNKF